MPPGVHLGPAPPSGGPQERPLVLGHTFAPPGTTVACLGRKTQSQVQRSWPKPRRREPCHRRPGRGPTGAGNSRGGTSERGADLRLNEHSHPSWPESKLERWKNDAAGATSLLVRGLGPRVKGSNDTINEAHSFKHLERELSRDIYTKQKSTNTESGTGGDQLRAEA